MPQARRAGRQRHGRPEHAAAQAAAWNLPAFSYYWTPTVRRPVPVEGQPHKMETVSYHEYKDQVFEASHGTHITPKFGEQLKLPPGRYLVSVGLVEVLWKNGKLRSSNADGSLSGPLSSYWAEVR